MMSADPLDRPTMAEAASAAVGAGGRWRAGAVRRCRAARHGGVDAPDAAPEPTPDPPTRADSGSAQTRRAARVRDPPVDDRRQRESPEPEDAGARLLVPDPPVQPASSARSRLPPALDSRRADDRAEAAPRLSWRPS